MRRVVPLAFVFLFGVTAGLDATYTVTNTSDAGPGSLRQAIIDANADATADTIVFNIPGSNVQTIAVLSPLPPIVNPVVIDGYTQPGSSRNTLADGNNAELRIELSGANSQAVTNRGIDIRAPGCTIRGLVINRFGSEGIAIGSSGNQVAGCVIGTDAKGTAPLRNGAGVWIQPSASDNRIGGTTPGDRNFISENYEQIVVSDDGSQLATNNVIEGNHLGRVSQDHILRTVVLNGARRVRTGGTAPGSRNIIVGPVDLSAPRGLPILPSSDNVIEGNHIDGQINLYAGCRNNRIGGASAVNGNEIHTVNLYGASENLVQGNSIRQVNIHFQGNR